jgi:hypothetical protein
MPAVSGAQVRPGAEWHPLKVHVQRIDDTQRNKATRGVDMDFDTSAFDRELTAMEGNMRSEAKRKLGRLSATCKGQSNGFIISKVKPVSGPDVSEKDLTEMVTVLKAGGKIDVK